MPAVERVKRREVKEVEGWAADFVHSGGKKFVTNYDANIWRPALAKFIQIFINSSSCPTAMRYRCRVCSVNGVWGKCRFLFKKTLYKCIYIYIYIYIPCEQNIELLVVTYALRSQKELNYCFGKSSQSRLKPSTRVF
jgi:hypothetical protein